MNSCVIPANMIIPLLAIKRNDQMRAPVLIIRKDKFVSICFICLFLLYAVNSFADVNWQEITSKHFVVKYAVSNQKLAPYILKLAEETHLIITQDIGYSLDKKTTIFICPSNQEFQELGGSPSKWTLGQAFTRDNVILIQTPKNIWRMEVAPLSRIEIDRVIRHEYTHIILGQIDGLPVWLNEGLAMYEAKQWQIDDNILLGEAYLSKHIIPLSKLTYSFPSTDGLLHHQKEIELAYAQSFDIVKFIINQYSNNGLKRLIKEMFKTNEFDIALKRSLGLTPLLLEISWHQDLKKRFNWLYIVTDSSLFWLALPILFLIIYLIKQYQVKKKRQQWAMEEGEE